MYIKFRTKSKDSIYSTAWTLNIKERTFVIFKIDWDNDLRVEKIKDYLVGVKNTLESKLAFVIRSTQL